MSKNLSQQVVLDRRGFVAATFATVAGLGLAGCSDTSAEADKGSAAGSSKSSKDTEVSATLDAKAFDKLVDNGPKADDDAIAASTWATAVKDAGVFKIGGVQTSTLFSLLNEKDGQTRGFDAGIAQLLSNYILGENKVEITQVTSDTRESVLQNGQVDAVFATYTITDERKKLVSFAGPYYYTQQDIRVEAYSPIAHGEALKNPAITAMAEKYGVSVPQLCIRYVIELGAVALPKTANPDHMASNAAVDFTILSEDMETLKHTDRIADYGEFNIFPVFSGKPLA